MANIKYDYLHRGERIIAQDVRISNNTLITGLNNNDLIIGPSGSGKTGGYVIPNLQNPDGSMIVSDTKGRLAKMFAKELKQKGYKVHVLDLVNPEKSIPYNPLKFIRRNKNGTINEKDVNTFVTALHTSCFREDKYWDMAARRYLTMLVAFTLEAFDENHHIMKTVVKMHNKCMCSNGITLIEQFANENPGSFTAKAFGGIGRMDVRVQRTWGCITNTANNSISIYDYAEFTPIFGKSDSFDITRIGKEKTVFFLNVSDTDTSFDQIANLFHAQALHALVSLADSRKDGKLPVPVRMILDDFAASAVIENFDKLISIIRSRELSVSIILQSLSQLETMYSKQEASTILNNCDHILYLGGHDLETADFMAAHANKTRTSIMSLPHHKAYLITDGMPARLVDKVEPYSTIPLYGRQMERKERDEEEI